MRTLGLRDVGFLGQDAMAPTFSPGDLANLFLWLEADSGARSGGGAAGDTDPVDEWIDQSVETLDAQQPVGGTEPIFSAAALNGLPILNFDGTADNMIIPDADIMAAVGDVTGNISGYALFRLTDLSQYHFIFSKNMSNASPELPEFRVEVTSGDVEIQIGGGTHTATTPLSAGVWYRAGFAYNQVTADVFHYLNGAADGSQATGIPSGINTRPLIIGSRDDNAFFLKGDLAALFIGKSVWTPTDFANLDAYIANKWIP